MQRTQVSLDPAERQRAKRKAADLGVSLAECIRRRVRDDLGAPSSRRDVRALFALGVSGGFEIATAKAEYIAEAFMTVCDD